MPRITIKTSLDGGNKPSAVAMEEALREACQQAGLHVVEQHTEYVDPAAEALIPNFLVTQWDFTS